MSPTYRTVTENKGQNVIHKSHTSLISSQQAESSLKALHSCDIRGQKTPQAFVAGAAAWGIVTNKPSKTVDSAAISTHEESFGCTHSETVTMNRKFIGDRWWWTMLIYFLSSLWLFNSRACFVIHTAATVAIKSAIRRSHPPNFQTCGTIATIHRAHHRSNDSFRAHQHFFLTLLQGSGKRCWTCIYRPSHSESHLPLRMEWLPTSWIWW